MSSVVVVGPMVMAGMVIVAAHCGHVSAVVVVLAA